MSAKLGEMIVSFRIFISTKKRRTREESFYGAGGNEWLHNHMAEPASAASSSRNSGSFSPTVSEFTTLYAQVANKHPAEQTEGKIQCLVKAMFLLQLRVVRCF